MKTKTEKIKKESGNCPYCSSPNCKLGFKDFFKSYTKDKDKSNANINS